MTDKDVIKNDIELFLSPDIIQGESVPFYVIWKRPDVKEIRIETEELGKITELHNVRSGLLPDCKVIQIKDLKSCYLGGVIKTTPSGVPYQEATMNVVVTLQSGELLEFVEKRCLYSTELEVTSVVSSVSTPIKTPPLEVLLRGDTTIFIDIKSDDDSFLQIDLSEDYINSFETFSKTVIDGIRRLTLDYPEYEDVINAILTIPEDLSLKQHIDKIVIDLETIASRDESFVDAFANVYINAILSNSIKDTLIVPIIEYIEASAASKVFLLEPLHSIKVPRGGGVLKATLSYRNLIERFSENIVPFNVFIENNSKESIIVPLKELIKIKRCELC